ncbi:MAG: antibiotic biosynthesis monooxygenase family protein [Chitinophagales bacterium]
MYAVIFTSQRTNVEKDYQSLNTQLEEIAAELDGFIKQDATRQMDGFGIAISYWKDEESAKQFKKVPLHIEAQQRGRSEFYEWYDVKICKVEREYQFSN